MARTQQAECPVNARPLGCPLIRYTHAPSVAATDLHWFERSASANIITIAVNHTIYIYIIRNADSMTTTMNKSKLRGNPDGSSGSIVITADTEAEAEAEPEAEAEAEAAAEGRGQRADSRQQTQTADSDSRLRQQTQTPKKRRGITAPPLTKLRGIKVFSALISLQTDPQLMVLKVERIAAGRAVRNIPLRIT